MRGAKQNTLCYLLLSSFFNLNFKQLIYLFAAIIVRRVVETQLFWNSFRIFHTSPALTKQPYTMFISIGFAPLFREGLKFLMA
jgi:hypothetical protein